VLLALFWAPSVPSSLRLVKCRIEKFLKLEILTTCSPHGISLCMFK